MHQHVCLAPAASGHVVITPANVTTRLIRTLDAKPNAIGLMHLSRCISDIRCRASPSSSCLQLPVCVCVCDVIVIWSRFRRSRHVKYVATLRQVVATVSSLLSNVVMTMNGIYRYESMDMAVGTGPADPADQ